MPKTGKFNINAYDTMRGFLYGQRWSGLNPTDENAPNRDRPEASPLEQYFWDHEEGQGIWKWLHYFDIYHRHFQKFRGQDVTILEIGVYSGGSLGMWSEYFGPGCQIHGVDIAPGCKNFENDQITVHIGDQEDRSFWKKFKDEVPPVDILVDDGGHQFEQQIVTLEEMLPHIKPGGVYLCEDTTAVDNEFVAYLNGLTMNLYGAELGTWKTTEIGTDAKRLAFQKDIASIHHYPYVSVIEMADEPIDWVASRKQGTHWKPRAE